jgi:hypothetical protein
MEKVFLDEPVGEIYCHADYYCINGEQTDCSFKNSLFDPKKKKLRMKTIGCLVGNV